MITWILVTKDYQISLKLSFSVIKHRDNLKQNPNISVGRFSCAEYLPLAWPMSDAGCTETNEMVPVPKKWVNGLLKQLPPVSHLPQQEQAEEQCCLPDTQGQKQGASFTKAKQEISPAPKNVSTYPDPPQQTRYVYLKHKKKELK